MEKSFDYCNVTGVHLELTTKCNAMCPMCNRNYKGSVRKRLPILELSLEQIRKIMPYDFIKQLKLISLCGVYGDPICNIQLKEILKYIYSCNANIDIDIYTNGSLYDTNWWRDLAELLSKYNHTVIFGIDGLADTHSIYRCYTNFDIIMQNAKAFIAGGGIAQWDYIVFKHNEHQVEEAKRVSEQMGFKEFQVKKTSRFLKSLFEYDNQLDSTILEYGKHPVFDKNGNIIHMLELPNDEKYRNQSEKIIFDILEKNGNLIDYFDKVDISCDSIVNGGIFISASGELFPCCTLYQQVFYKLYHDVKDYLELNEYESYKKYDMSVINRDIYDVMNNGFFDDVIESFSCNSISEGKFKSCARTCGKKLELHKNTHSTTIKYEWGL